MHALFLFWLRFRHSALDAESRSLTLFIKEIAGQARNDGKHCLQELEHAFLFLNRKNL